MNIVGMIRILTYIEKIFIKKGYINLFRASQQTISLQISELQHHHHKYLRVRPEDVREPLVSTIISRQRGLNLSLSYSPYKAQKA